jgi:hypothetical protein
LTVDLAVGGFPERSGSMAVDGKDRISCQNTLFFPANIDQLATVRSPGALFNLFFIELCNRHTLAAQRNISLTQN